DGFPHTKVANMAPPGTRQPSLATPSSVNKNALQILAPHHFISNQSSSTLQSKKKKKKNTSDCRFVDTPLLSDPQTAVSKRHPKRSAIGKEKINAQAANQFGAFRHWRNGPP